jgi:mRNA-degrading endonuclease toxin of MazEF toxin-antitoxin module
MRGKKRPAVVIQADAYVSLHTVVIAEVTSNLAMAADPACLSIDIETPDGRATGVVRNCVVSGLVLVTVYADTVVQTLGSLSPSLLRRLDGCLKVALALP